MKNYRRFLLTALAAIVCSAMCMACYSTKEADSNDLKKVTRDVAVGYFSKVESYGSADIKFTQGTKASVRIVGAKRLVDNLDVRLKGETLVVAQKGNDGIRFNGNIFSKGMDYSVTVYVVSPDLTTVNIKGSGDFAMTGDLDTDALSVNIMGSGDVSMRKVVCDKASLVLSGSGDLKANAIECRSAELLLRGSGDMDVKQLRADNADINLRGSGDLDAALYRVASINASVIGSGDMELDLAGCGTATCEVRGSGDMELKGSLRSISKTVKGTGEIDTKGLTLGR